MNNVHNGGRDGRFPEKPRPSLAGDATPNGSIMRLETDRKRANSACAVFAF